ncbi:MAG: ABC transporter permease [Elusimicrobia bacterium]|nr:ABC transporter permease [Elusimicrobiota bacterium]
MNLEEAFQTGLREIRAHAFRSILSFSAVSVGVGSILYTFAQTHGMREALDRSIELMGAGRMQIQAKRNYVSRGLSPGLIWEDVLEIERAIPEIQMIYPKVRRWNATLHCDGKKVENIPIQGTTHEWRKRDWVYGLRGRFLDRWDVENAARVAVVIEPGGWVQKPFWASWWTPEPLDRFVSRHDLLGKPIRLENRQFTVVGVIKAPPRDKDPRWFHWEQTAVLIPVTSYHRYLGNEKTKTAIDEIQLDSGNPDTVVSVKGRIDSILKRRHRGEDDYEIQDNRSMIQEELQDTQRYIWVGTILGMVALLAGGIGIMNVTLASIFARVKEIGIRRAIGATRTDILAQFLTEAMILGLAGGLAGVGLGYAGVAYLGRDTERDLTTLTWYHMAAVILIGVAVSCISALYPAKQAAALDPVTALKDE